MRGAESPARAITPTITAAILMPLAALIISLGIKPYGREVERLEALE